MKKVIKQSIICGLLLSGGIAMIITGIYMPPLLAVGVAMFSAGLAIVASILEDKDKVVINNNIINFGKNASNDAINDPTAGERPNIIRRLSSAGVKRIIHVTEKLRGAASNHKKNHEPLVFSKSGHMIQHDEEKVDTCLDEVALDLESTIIKEATKKNVESLTHE